MQFSRETPATIEVGNAVVIPYQFYKGEVRTPILVDPDYVTLTLKDPAGTVKVNDEAMTKVSTGYWQYIYQTVLNDVHGDWIRTVKVVRAGKTNYDTSVAFTLVAGG